MTTRGLTLLPPIYSEEYPAASDDTVLLIGVGCSQDNKNPTYDEDARSDLSILVKKHGTCTFVCKPCARPVAVVWGSELELMVSAR